MSRVLLQFATVGGEHEKMLNLAFPAHSSYCDFHCIDYLPEHVERTSRHPWWYKVDMIARAFVLGYQRVAYLDADCLIVDPSVDILAASGYGIAVCECLESPFTPRHLNCGAVYLTASPEVRAFVDVWLNSDTGHPWQDQQVFNELMAARPWRDLLTILPNRYNCVETHMEASRPVVRAFHGDPDRVAKMAALADQQGRRLDAAASPNPRSLGTWR